MKTFLTCLAITSLVLAAGAQSTETNLHLWSQVTADAVFVPNQPISPYRGPSQEFIVTLWLVNEGDQPMNPHLDNSKLIVNGKDLKENEPEPLFGQGPWRHSWLNLRAHEVTKRTLYLTEYFQKPGNYRISWKGQGFESPEVTVRVLNPTVYLDDENKQQPLSEKKAKILQKINEIKVPQVDMDDKTVGDLAEFLSKESVKLDRDHEGVKIELRDPRSIPSIKPGKVWRGLPLITAIQYISQLSCIPYDIEEDKVVFHFP